MSVFLSTGGLSWRTFQQLGRHPWWAFLYFAAASSLVILIFSCVLRPTFNKNLDVIKTTSAEIGLQFLPSYTQTNIRRVTETRSREDQNPGKPQHHSYKALKQDNYLFALWESICLLAVDFVRHNLGELSILLRTRVCFARWIVSFHSAWRNRSTRCGC